MTDFNRRDALKLSAGLALAAGGFSCIEMAKAGPIDVPTIDKLSVRVIVDSASDIFFRPQTANGVKTEPGRSAVSLRPLHSEWGLSLLLEPQRGLVFADLRLDAIGRPGVISATCSQFIGCHDRYELVSLDRIPFLNKKLADLPAHLRPYNHVFGGNNSSENQRTRRLMHRVIGACRHARYQQQKD